MKQTRRQRAASLRNLRKARSKRRGSTRRRRRRNPPRRRRARTRARRRNSSSMPVVLVNPSGKTRRRRRRANPTKRRRRRRVAVKRYNRRYPRLRNPTGTWGGSLMAWLLGGVGGAVAGGMDWGADYLPWPAWAQATTLGGAGTVTAIAVCRWADVRAGCGIAGGTIAMVLNRLRQIIALSRTAPTTGAQSASAVYRGAGAVEPARNAGQMVRARTGARTMPAPNLGTRSFRQADATFPAYGTRFGPNSWVYGMGSPGAGVVLVSAHNRRTR
jgi:hypothetical protein